jgi:hypothetical protein
MPYHRLDRRAAIVRPEKHFRAAAALAAQGAGELVLGRQDQPPAEVAWRVRRSEHAADLTDPTTTAEITDNPGVRLGRLDVVNKTATSPRTRRCTNSKPSQFAHSPSANLVPATEKEPDERHRRDHH